MSCQFWVARRSELARGQRSPMRMQYAWQFEDIGNHSWIEGSWQCNCCRTVRITSGDGRILKHGVLEACGKRKGRKKEMIVACGCRDVVACGGMWQAVRAIFAGLTTSGRQSDKHARKRFSRNVRNVGRLTGLACMCLPLCSCDLARHVLKRRQDDNS